VSVSPNGPFSFGNQPVGSPSAPIAVTIANNGSAALMITSITVGTGNTGDFSIGSSTCGASLAVNASCILNVIFDPTASGSRNAGVTITGNAGGGPITVMLTGTGVFNLPPVTVKAGGGAFGGPMLLLLGALGLLRRPRGKRHRHVAGLLGLGGMLLCGGIDPASAADDSMPASFTDHLYAGLRLGALPVDISKSSLDRQLAERGYPGVHASADTGAVGGTVYLGYQFIPYAGVEFGYAYRIATVLHLSGTVLAQPAPASIQSLLQTATGLVRGYGDIFSLTLRGRYELLAGLTINPRVGGYLWDSDVTADSGTESARTTHSGGGFSFGGSLAYRVWRGLEIGAGADRFQGNPSNNATLYAATVEWRFGG
jgi:hypothetical protein